MIGVQFQTPGKESGTPLLMSSTAIADFVPRHGSGGHSFCVLASGSMHAITTIIRCIQEFTSSSAEGIHILLPESLFRIPLDQQHGT